VRFCCPSTRGNYQSNVALYPRVREYFGAHRPPLLAAWGTNDPFFLLAGAEAFKRDIPEAAVRFLDTGHFAVETHAGEIAATIREFLARSAKVLWRRARSPEEDALPASCARTRRRTAIATRRRWEAVLCSAISRAMPRAGA